MLLKIGLIYGFLFKKNDGRGLEMKVFIISIILS